MALFIVAADPGSPTEIFCKQFAATFLRRMELHVLDEKNSSSLLSKMNRETIMCIAPGFTLGGKHQSMLTAINKNNVTLLFKDSKVDDMKDYVAVAAVAPYVVVHNVLDGRKQQVVMISDAPATAEAETGNIEMDHPEDDSAATSGQKAKKSAKPKITTKPSEPVSVPVAKAGVILKHLAETLADDSFYQKYQKSEVHYWQYDTTLVLWTLDTTVTYPDTGEYPDWLDGSHVTAFYAVSISIYATKTPRKKYIKFMQTDACGVSPRMEYDNDEHRGHFLWSADTYICSGWVGDPEYSQSLPSGWIRPHIEPHTPNSATTYVSTTGWGVSVAGGGSPDGPSANVTASYNQSNQVTRTVYDFSVRNRSTDVMSGWNFYYTAMDGNGWFDHTYYKAFWGYAIKGIADLAKSTMHLNTEAVYEGPTGYKESMNFKVFYRPKVGLLWSQGSVFVKHIYWWTKRYEIVGKITLFPGKVTHPQ